MLEFVDGDRMNARAAVPLPKVVRSGETVDLAVDMVAPGIPGKYRGYWMLSNAYGHLFGIGADASVAFWVDIRVKTPSSQYAYDFAFNVCAASWRSSARGLPCPGDSASADGSIVVLYDPRLETGKHENEPALWTRPQPVNGGWIMGTYPNYKVQAGDHFVSDVGCLIDSQGCDVTFYVSYLTSGQPVKDLGTFREVYDGRLTRIDIDLSPLEGRTVQFILTVVANSKPFKANAFWLVPSIRRMPLPPPFTRTPTQKPPTTLTPTPTATSTWENLPAVIAAKQTIAQALGVSANQIAVTYVVAVEWADTCLGIQIPGQVCAPAIIPGYRILLAFGQRHFEAHTNQDGSIVYWYEY